MVLHSAVTHFHKWCSTQDTPMFHPIRPHIITTKVEHDAIKLPLLQKYSLESGKKNLLILILKVTNCDLTHKCKCDWIFRNIFFIIFRYYISWC